MPNPQNRWRCWQLYLLANAVTPFANKIFFSTYFGKKKAVFIVEKEVFDDEDALMEIVLEAGAEDMKAEDEVFEITAEPEAFDAIEQALGEKGIETASAEVTMVPDTTVHLEGKDADKMQQLVDALEENDDVQNVYSNYDIDEE